MTAVAKNLYGVFPIYKPAGCSTSSILKTIKSNLGTDRIAHSGALNNYSEGIMVLGVGKAVKYVPAIREHARMYLVRGVLGVATNTYDACGDYSRVSPYKHVSENALREALNECYVGKIEQIPPVLPSFRFLQKSKLFETRLVPREPCKVTINSIEIVEFEPPSFQLHIHSVGRVYTTSLVNDLGEVLDSAAHVTHLCRVSQGDFGFREALHYYDWNEETVQNNLYLPSNDPELNKPTQ